MLKPLSRWNLFYLSIALECDSPILEAIFHHNPWSSHCRHIENFFDLLYSKTSPVVNASHCYPSRLNFDDGRAYSSNTYQLAENCICEVLSEKCNLYTNSLIYLATELRPGIFILVFLKLLQAVEKKWELTGGDINILAGKSCIGDGDGPKYHNLQNTLLALLEAKDISSMIISAERRHLDFNDPFWDWSTTKSIDFEQKFNEKFTNQYLGLDDDPTFPSGLRKALEIVKDFNKL